MRLELSAAQREARQRFREFARSEIAPRAGEWDRSGELPVEIVERLRVEGYLGSTLPTELGGGGADAITYGLLTEELGKACSSVRSLLTVHDMVCVALSRWATGKTREDALPPLVSGRRRAAVGLTEELAGSDAAGVETRATRVLGGYEIEGRKICVTFGEIAAEILVLAVADGGLSAFLVDTSSPGVVRRPARDLVGARASGMAEVEFQRCRIGAERLIGREGFGLSHVLATALDHGRYSVAWGSVGIAQGCLEACLDHSSSRHQFGRPLRDHQLVRRLLTRMVTETRAARLLCCRAGWLRDNGAVSAVGETAAAKYFAARTAARVANEAVRLHGARGLSERLPLERYLREAKAVEIIEGSQEILETSIPDYVLEDF